MSQDSFDFRQFSIDQTGCAMRVGTDGVLLGAWAGECCATDASLRCLDVGSGTGLVALMLAQRFSQARIEGVEIEPTAADCARSNAAASPFSERVNIHAGDFLAPSFLSTVPASGYDLIVSNPPYFRASLHAPDRQRTVARHEGDLTLEKLMEQAARLLGPNGLLALVTPYDRLGDLRMYAASSRLTPTRLTEVRTLPHKQPKRLLSEWRHADTAIDMPPLVSDTLIIHPAAGYYSPEYARLTGAFYTTSLRILATG